VKDPATREVVTEGGEPKKMPFMLVGRDWIGPGRLYDQIYRRLFKSRLSREGVSKVLLEWAPKVGVEGKDDGDTVKSMMGWMNNHAKVVLVPWSEKLGEKTIMATRERVEESQQTDEQKLAAYERGLKTKDFSGVTRTTVVEEKVSTRVRRLEYGYIKDARSGVPGTVTTVRARGPPEYFQKAVSSYVDKQPPFRPPVGSPDAIEFFKLPNEQPEELDGSQKKKVANMAKRFGEGKEPQP
jgi:hypothetical protein